MHHAPTALIEIRPGNDDVAETRQGAIGTKLHEAGIEPVFVDMNDPDSFSDDGRHIANFKVLDPENRGRLITGQPGRLPFTPDTYRIRDVPEAARPAFARDDSETAGYNSGRLCGRLLTRLAMRNVLLELGLADHMTRAVSVTPHSAGRRLELVEGDMVFVKPNAYSDVGGDQETVWRRARYVPRQEAAAIAEDPRCGNALLQADEAAPLSEIIEQYGAALPGKISGLARRRHHTIRLYQMTKAQGDAGTTVPDLAEIRLLASEDIGKPEPPDFILAEPEIVFNAFADSGLQDIQQQLASGISERYGINYCASDYIISASGRAMLTALHVRPWLPSIRDTDLGRRSVETEVAMLQHLASRPSTSETAS